MDRITDRVWIGSSRDGKDKAPVRKKNGVFFIVNANEQDFLTMNCAIDLDVEASIHVGFVDGGGNPVWKVGVAIDSLRSILAHSDKPILVYCHEGRSRSVCVVASYLVFGGVCKDINSAIAMIKEKRSIANPNEALIKTFNQFIRGMNCTENNSE